MNIIIWLRVFNYVSQGLTTSKQKLVVEIVGSIINFTYPNVRAAGGNWGSTSGTNKWVHIVLILPINEEALVFKALKSFILHKHIVLISQKKKKKRKL